MSRTTRVMQCTPADVWAVLEDAWSYGMWVVGAARIRDVEMHWPQVGSKIHHSVGAWPVLLSDHTEVERMEPNELLQLRVKAWPTGEGRVTLTIKPSGEGETEVAMEEQAISGPATLLPKPAQDFMLDMRNKEALLRLSYIAEHHARSRG
ncbi:MAG TPA: SRPBCC family protein [Nocardioidaceae bacterium]|nr:SRPBCC family protein [Nocardioidaceae bacterium]